MQTNTRRQRLCRILRRTNGATWKPAKPNFLESASDGFYNYNFVPGAVADWLGGLQSHSSRARQAMARLMIGRCRTARTRRVFLAGYKLDGSNISREQL